MPTYIMLSTLTPEGVQTVKNNPQRIQEVNKEVEQLGATVKAQWATLGHVDFISVDRGARRGHDGARLARAGLARHRPLRDAGGDPRRRLHRARCNGGRERCWRTDDAGRTLPAHAAWRDAQRDRPSWATAHAEGCRGSGRPGRADEGHPRGSARCARADGGGGSAGAARRHRRRRPARGHRDGLQERHGDDGEGRRASSKSAASCTRCA